MLSLKTVFFSLVGLVGISAIFYPLLLRSDFRFPKSHQPKEEDFSYSHLELDLSQDKINNSSYNSQDTFHLEDVFEEFKPTNVPHVTVASSKENQTRHSPYTLPAEVRHEMKNRFLFPIVHIGGGPNFQYRQLKIAIQLAVFTNRTLVLPDFKHHRTVNHLGRVTFEETFNMSIFEEFMPAIDIKHLKEKCGPRIDDILTFISPFARSSRLPIEHAYAIQRAYVRSRVDVELPHVDSVKFPTSEAESWRGIEKSAGARCVVMLVPITFERVRLPQMAKVSNGIAGHLVRTQFLRRAVEDVLPKLCDGKPVLGFHWRNKTGEQCRIGHLGKSKDRRCQELLKMQYKVIGRLAAHISEIMQHEDIGCAFIASAPLEPRTNIIREFAAQNVSRVISSDDVIALHHPDINSFRDDDYFISQLEQEICARSKVFIGIGKSNWSKFLFQERSAFNSGPTYDVITDFPDILYAKEYV